MVVIVGCSVLLREREKLSENGGGNIPRNNASVKCSHILREAADGKGSKLIYNIN